MSLFIYSLRPMRQLSARFAVINIFISVKRDTTLNRVYVCFANLCAFFCVFVCAGFCEICFLIMVSFRPFKPFTIITIHGSPFESFLLVTNEKLLSTHMYTHTPVAHIHVYILNTPILRWPDFREKASKINVPIARAIVASSKSTFWSIATRCHLPAERVREIKREQKQ